MGILQLGLAVGSRFGGPGIDHLRPNARRLQGRIRALPVDARAFHHYTFGRKPNHPLGQCLSIPLECAKLPLCDLYLAVWRFNDRTGRDLRLVNIQPDDAFIDGNKFHTASFGNILDSGRRRVPEPNMPEGDKSSTASLTCALYGGNPGYESVRRVTLGCGVKPPKNCATSSRLLPTYSVFHYQGWRYPQSPLGCHNSYACFYLISARI